jgi:hypothetical protein
MMSINKAQHPAMKNAFSTYPQFSGENQVNADRVPITIDRKGQGKILIAASKPSATKTLAASA